MCSKLATIGARLTVPSVLRLVRRQAAPQADHMEGVSKDDLLGVT